MIIYSNALSRLRIFGSRWWRQDKPLAEDHRVRVKWRGQCCGPGWISRGPLINANHLWDMSLVGQNHKVFITFRSGPGKGELKEKLK